MPNNITNRLIIEGPQEDVDKVFDFIKSDTPDKNGEPILIDFNKIKPMPESLDCESSSEGQNGKQYILGMSGNEAEKALFMKSGHYEMMQKMKATNLTRFEKCIKLGQQYLHNKGAYGYETWYGWSIDNWGTKWNAYNSYKDSENTLSFETAWDGVPDLMSELASLFPNLIFKYDYADEDRGYNVGSYIFKGEDIEDNSPEDNTAEAWAIVFEIGVACEEDYVQQPDGSYKYREEEE